MSSRRTPQWAQQPGRPRRPGNGRPAPRRSGWRPQDWSVKRGLAVGLSGAFILLVAGGIAGAHDPKDQKAASAAASTRPAAAAAVTTTAPPPTTAPASASPSPSPTDTLAVLPDLSGTDLQSARDHAQELGYYRLTSHDLTGRGRRQVVDRDWHVCSQSPGKGAADPSTTTVTFNVVKNGESCSLRVHATPSPTRPPTHALTHAPTHHPSGGSSPATCAPHTVGSCAAGSPHPSGATAQCDDGTYSWSATFRGTCSHHGGVRYWYR